MTRLRLKLLGDFAATDGNGAAVELSSRKCRCLLAFLCLNSRRSVPRERLASLLWSDRADPQARSSLRQALTVLRKEIGDGALAVDDERIELRDCESDVEAFARLAASTDRHDLQQALELWSGNLLADLFIADPVFSQWLEAERSRLTELLKSALLRLMALSEAGERIVLAQKLVGLDCLREASHLALMEAYAEAGERARALGVYEELRNLLKAELGVAPAPDIEAFRARLLAEGKAQPPLLSGPAVKPSVLVLPFANLSGDASRQYVSDGITEDLISLLGRSSELNVVTRNPLSLTASAATTGQLAQSLGADYVVRGAARAATAGLVVSCQLVDGVSGNVVWSERYERQAEDVFAVIDEVAVRIATALGSRLVSLGAKLAGRKPTDSWSAYDHFLKGRELCNAGKEWEAEAFFAKSVAIDARFAMAHAWRALGYLGQFWRHGDLQCLQNANASAEEALRQDPTEPTSHYAAGTVLNYRLEYDQSAYHFQRAIALNPLDVNIQCDYASLLLCKGQFDEALKTVDAVLTRDPYPPTWITFVRGKVLFFMGEYAASIRSLELAHWGYRSHVYLAASLAHLGLTEQASQQVVAIYSIHPTVTVGEIRLTSGIRNEAMLFSLFRGLELAGFRA